ncbi:hypothetical protein SxD43FB_22045 [Sphingobium sp. D43FB]|nr:hypothetical protein SxD43FB_22045 [Sphingobium sp. D43FB]
MLPIKGKASSDQRTLAPDMLIALFLPRQNARSPTFSPLHYPNQWQRHKAYVQQMGLTETKIFIHNRQCAAFSKALSMIEGSLLPFPVFRTGQAEGGPVAAVGPQK